MLEDLGSGTQLYRGRKRRKTDWLVGLVHGDNDGSHLPVTAADDRIKAALLGLMGSWGPNGDSRAYGACT